MGVADTGNNTVVFDFFIPSRLYSDHVRTDLEQAFDNVIISGYGPFDKITSGLIADCPYVKSSVVMGDMPLRIIASAQASITILTKRILPVISSRIYALPCSIKIIDDCSNVCATMKISGENYVSVDVMLSEEKRTAIEASKSIINILSNSIHNKVTNLLSEKRDEHICVDIDYTSLISGMYVSSDDCIEFVLSGYQIARSTLNAQECAISLLVDDPEIVVAFYRTIADTKIFTISKIGNLSLSELYFTETG